MSKVNHCLNGRPVTEQVVLYQESRKSDDYVPVKWYYDNYKEVWFRQLKDYMDRMTFDSEFDFRLVRAVDTFNAVAATEIASSRGLSFLGNFNRWFYKILTNWKSNVKTSSFRLKKRPSVQCPICGRFVGRIDVDHLKHYKTISDLPKHMTWKKNIYEVVTSPKVYAVTWGEKTVQKWKDLTTGEAKNQSQCRRRVRWPWRLRDETRGVLCPFTKKVVAELNDRYIRGLSDKHCRYAKPTSWEEFVFDHPSALIQSEIYDLDHAVGSDRDRVFLKDHIPVPEESTFNGVDHEMIVEGKIPVSFEHTFNAIDVCIANDEDRDILKLVASGYSVEDIAETLETSKREVRQRMRSIRDSNKDLERMLKE